MCKVQCGPHDPTKEGLGLHPVSTRVCHENKKRSCTGQRGRAGRPETGKEQTCLEGAIQGSDTQLSPH